MTSIPIEKRNILVTGAAAGIGRAICEMFAEDPHHHLILLDSNLNALQQWVETQPICASVEILGVDIADIDSLESVFADLSKRISFLHVLINCAGVCDENEPEDIVTWRRVIDINLHGTYAVTALSLPLMSAGGRIINMSSILGRAGKVRNTAYCASKHAIVGMTKALALDLAPRKITANAILPAWVDSPMLQRELAAQASTAGLTLAEIQRSAKRRLPQRRFIESREIAALVKFLCSEEACGITAQSMVVDGGAGLGM